MNSKILFLGAVMMLPTFASCQQEKPFPDDAVDKVYEYLPEWQAGYLDIHQISTGRGNAAYLIFPDGRLPCCWMQEIWEYTPVPRRL